MSSTTPTDVLQAEIPSQRRSELFDKLLSPELTVWVVVFIWAGNFAALKNAYTQLAPAPLAAVRFALATALMMALLYWREGDCRFPPGTFWKFLWLGIVGNTIYQMGFANGLAYTTTANSSLIVTATPAVIAVIGGLLGVERITRNIVFGLALTMVGVLVVMSKQGLSLSSQTLKGDLMVLGSVFCWALYVLGMRTIGDGISSLRATTMTMITGAPGLVLLGLPGLAKTDWTQVGGAGLFGIFYSAALSLVLCYLLYNRNVRLLGGVKTTIYSCVIPVIAALIAWPVLGERPTWLQALGAVLIIAGVLVTRRK